MLKIETAVYRVLITALVLVCSLAFAKKDSDDKDNESGWDCNKLDDKYGAVEESKLPPRIRAAFETCNSGGAGGCSNIVEDYKKAKGELAGVCPQIAPGARSRPGFPLCTYDLVRCEVCMSGAMSTPQQRKKFECGETKKAEDSASQLSLAATTMAKFCPAELGANAEEIEKKANVARTNAREARKRATEAEKAVNSAQKTSQEAANEKENQLMEAENEYKRQLEEATEGEKEDLRRIQDQVFQHEQSIAQLEAQMGQARTKKLEIDLTYRNEVRQIEINCHASALQIVTKLQEVEVEKLKSGTLYKGDFNQILSKAGISNKQQWQQKANEHYQLCLASHPTNASRRAAREKMNVAIKAVEQEEAAFQQQIDSVRKKIESMQSNNCGEGQVRGQLGSDKCEAMQKAERKAKRLKEEFARKKKMLNKQKMQAQQQSQKELASLNKEKAEAEKEYREEDARYNALKKAQIAAYQNTGLSAKDAEKFTAAKEKYQDYRAKAAQLVECRKSDCASIGECQEAKALLMNAEQLDLSDVPSATTTPATTTGPSGGGDAQTE